MTGVSIMKIDRGMDTGDVLSMKEVPVPPDATAGYMETLLASEGAGLLLETIAAYSRGEISPVEQDHEKATYAPKLAKSDGEIDWNRPASKIHNLIRAMNPRPGAITSFREGSTDLKIWKSSVTKGDGGTRTSAGTICSITSDGLDVACGRGTTLRIEEVQLCGRSRISAADFVNGCGVVEGEALGS